MAMDFKTIRKAAAGMLREKSPLAALLVLYEQMGGFIQIPLPGFRAWITGGPAVNRQILVTQREKLSWRSPDDPVSALLGRGLLVIDGPEHDLYRSSIEPLLGPGELHGYVNRILNQVDRVTATWQAGQCLDMLVECRQMALLIVMDTLFGVDFWQDMPRLWKPIRKAIDYISPGAWIFSPHLPRWGFRKPLKILDQYLYGIIRDRRQAATREDLLGCLIAAGLDDERIRDQMLTLLIAGHDTTTALLAWAFYLLGSHPGFYATLEAELDRALHGMPPPAPSGWQPRLLDDFLKETLRLYPPIHLGSRRAVEDLELDGYPVCAGERVMYSIYLTHRDPAVWAEPNEFNPQRFVHGGKAPPFAFIPFGGGPRACPGAAFGLAEARLVLARLLQTFHFQLENPDVHTHMGATLEPRPGVRMRVFPRQQECL